MTTTDGLGWNSQDLKMNHIMHLAFFYTPVQNEKDLNILTIRIDHGGKFENKSFEIFCVKHGIHHDFICPRTDPQQNGIVERKNRSLQEMTRMTMIHETNMAINTLGRSCKHSILYSK